MIFVPSTGFIYERTYVMHYWGDEGVDWDGINDAADFLDDYFRKRWKIGVRQSKEKYGTVRVYCSLGWMSPHDITHPGYCFSRYPKWLWHLNCRCYGAWFWKPIQWASTKVHCWAYRRGYKLAVKKWPHLSAEILSAADFSDLLHNIVDSNVDKSVMPLNFQR